MAAKFGRRFYRGAATTAVAALALAALTASQAPGATERLTSGTGDPAPPPPADVPIDGGSPYYTELPPLNSPVPPGSSKGPGRGDGTIGTGPAEAGIPATVLDAYKKAESSIGASDPGCKLPWQLLAAIGKVESGQANGGDVDDEGTTRTPIRGPQLNGKGFANISDTDGGLYDGDTTHDRAIGPMQFIPSTWAQGGPDGKGWGADGNGDGKRDPNNIYDAALAAGHYLCNGNRDLSVQGDLDRAILGYNRSSAYLSTVLSWLDYYRRGTHEVPDGSGVRPKQPKSHGGPGTGSGSGTGTGTGGGRGDGGARGGGKGSGQGSGGGSGHGSGPGTTPRPHPSEPGGQEKPSPPHKPGGDSGKPTPPKPSRPPKPSQPPTLTGLERVGERSVSATADEEFADRPAVRAKNSKGKAVEGLRVRYEIRGTTDARFPGGAKDVTVLTGKDGVATAPVLRAGRKTGSFVVRATAVGHDVPAADFAATVKARPAPKADRLARTSDKKLTVVAGQALDEGTVEVKATFKGKAAAGVPVTATMVTDDPAKPVENDKGPYFKAEQAGAGEGGDTSAGKGTTPSGRASDESADAGQGKDKAGDKTADPAKDKPVRTLTTLKTDADGLLVLPKIYTDEHTGTFRLRLTTADGAELIVELTVTAPPAA